jgi:hypothetical protein
VRQDDEDHHVKRITLPPNSELLIDLAIRPKLSFVTSEIYFGCEGGDVKDLPYAIEYFNRFIEVGAGRNIRPGIESTHYIDKYRLYHIKEPVQWSVGSTRSIAFKMITTRPGVYKVKIFFPGDAVEGMVDDLWIYVEESPRTRMHCIRPDHAHMACSVGIPPISPLSSLLPPANTVRQDGGR